MTDVAQAGTIFAGSPAQSTARFETFQEVGWRWLLGWVMEPFGQEREARLYARRERWIQELELWRSFLISWIR